MMNKATVVEVEDTQDKDFQKEMLKAKIKGAVKSGLKVVAIAFAGGVIRDVMVRKLTKSAVTVNEVETTEEVE